jgi:hypothetical protein
MVSLSIFFLLLCKNFFDSRFLWWVPGAMARLIGLCGEFFLPSGNGVVFKCFSQSQFPHLMANGLSVDETTHSWSAHASEPRFLKIFAVCSIPTAHRHFRISVFLGLIA